MAERKFVDDVKIDMNNLQEEFVNQPIIFAEYGMEYALAESKEKQAKAELEATMADLYLQIRNHKIESGEKFTEGLLDAEIKKHPQYYEATQKYIKAQTNKQVAKVKVEALMQRRDMLLQLGAISRAEMNNMLA